jgi:hypothetical protein
MSNPEPIQNFPSFSMGSVLLIFSFLCLFTLITGPATHPENMSFPSFSMGSVLLIFSFLCLFTLITGPATHPENMSFPSFSMGSVLLIFNFLCLFTLIIIWFYLLFFYIVFNLQDLILLGFILQIFNHLMHVQYSLKSNGKSNCVSIWSSDLFVPQIKTKIIDVTVD